MPGSFVERERKFDVEPTFEVPDLDAAVPPGSATVRSVQQLRSDYFDTADHAVRRAGLTLRRRTGTDDVGWHLKLPDGEHREEVHFDPADEIPADVTRLLMGITRGAPLSVVATVETERHVTRIVDTAGGTVADLDLDHVRSTAAPNGRPLVSSWTELEVELGGPHVPEEQLSLLERAVRDAGARPSRARSKLERALGESPDRGKRNKKKQQQRRKGAKAKPRSGEVLRPYLVEQQRMLLSGDVALRRGDDAVIHKTRVATRRLRSALRVFPPLLDPARAHALDEELRWYAELLGAVRDGQVLEARLDGALTHLSPELVLGPVQQRIDDHLEAKRAADWERLQEELSESRYLRLLGELAAWGDAPPFTGRAARPARQLVRLAGKANRTVARHLRAANRSGDVDLLHRARKAAKRARYAAEAVVPVAGERAVREADRYRKLQDLLGEHQDSVVSAELLLELGAAERENGFTFGVLHQVEQQRAAAARDKAQRVARRYS